MDFIDFKKIKGVIFDFDGTLADSLGVWGEIDIQFMKKRGFEVPEGYEKIISAMNFIQAAEYTIELMGLKETPQQVAQEWYEMAISEYAHNVYFKENAKRFVEILRSKGIKTAIATASERELIFPALENNKASQLFDAIATTSEVKRGKGFPDVYDLARDRLGLRTEECVVVEDILQGIQGAKIGGYIAVGVYEKRSEESAQEIKKNADFYVQNFTQLIDMILS